MLQATRDLAAMSAQKNGMTFLPVPATEWYARHVVIGTQAAQQIQQAPQGSDMWHQARQFRLSGSRIADVLGHGFYIQEDVNAVVRPFLWPKPLNSPWVSWGSKHEIDAQRVCEETLRKRFSNHIVSFEYPGGIVIRSEEWFIASVDGIATLSDRDTGDVVERLLLEFKCPKTIAPRIKAGYVDQVQAYMGFLRLHDPTRYATMNRCIFAQWTPQETKFEEFMRHDDYFEELRTTCKRFYFAELLPRLILKYFGLLQPEQTKLTKPPNAAEAKPIAPAPETRPKPAARKFGSMTLTLGSQPARVRQKQTGRHA